MKQKRVVLADLFFTQSNVGQPLPSSDPRHIGQGWHDISDIREAIVFADAWNPTEGGIFWSIHLKVTPDNPVDSPLLTLWKEARMPANELVFLTYNPQVNTDETYFKIGENSAWSNVTDQIDTSATYQKHAAFYNVLPFNYCRIILAGGPWSSGSDGQNLRVTLIGK